MDFKFTHDKPAPEGDKDNNDGDLVPDSEDLTKGLSEADVRKALNHIGRAAAHMFIACTIMGEQITEEDDGVDPSPITIMTYKSRMKHVMTHLTPVVKDNNPLRVVFPLFRI